AAQEATPEANQDGAEDQAQDGLSQEVVEAFRVLPGQKGLKLWAPPDAGRPEWSVWHDPDEQLFIASAFKGFVLAECLRLEEAALDPRSDTPLAVQLNARLAQQLPLDEAVFSPDATVFNPPNLTGAVSLRTALEAMISHSDNTATDMVLRHVGSERVQAFVEEIGLRQTRIPASTRQFIGYIFGVADWQATTWAETQGAGGTPRPILNDTITMASTPADLVSFYARALQGEFFRYAETLAVLRAILRLADAIPRSMPLGVSGFGKGGAITFGGSNALTFAGGMYVPDRWVYFALLLNWTDDEVGPDSAIQGQYIAAAKTIFTLVRNRLGA
ncbi:MAG: serine hydrolase, partial [Chloroflexia bacterium]|nr:serine hydrolase [Chloroflexia bacterium]